MVGESKVPHNDLALLQERRTNVSEEGVQMGPIAAAYDSEHEDLAMWEMAGLR